MAGHGAEHHGGGHGGGHEGGGHSSGGRHGGGFGERLIKEIIEGATDLAMRSGLGAATKAPDIFQDFFGPKGKGGGGHHGGGGGGHH